ncbi:MAG: esterase family protein [Clostridia bacterium]|nr:esterase family protein [Clostridia bacterium]
MALMHTHLLSNVLGMYISVEVLLPQTEVPEHGFRTVWLLHGWSDDETMWTRRTSLERYADQHKVAVIMPTVHLSCYTDMTHGLKYYTFVSEELPELMRNIFPLSCKREDNAVAGLSMGGEGSLKIGLSKPENFGCIGCLSAGAHNEPWNPDPKPDDPYFFLQHSGKKLEGIPEDTFGNAEKILKEGLPVPRIYHAIGSSDPLLDSAHETKAFFEAIPGNPFSYTYEEHPGSHNWEFWDTHIKRFLNFFDGKEEL